MTFSFTKIKVSTESSQIPFFGFERNHVFALFNPQKLRKAFWWYLKP